MAGPYRDPLSSGDDPGEDPDLGARVSVHPVQWGRRAFALAFTTVILGLVFLRLAGVAGLGLLAVGVGGVALFAAAVSALSPHAIVLFEEGVEVHRRFGRPRRVRFDECAFVYREISTVGRRLVTSYALRLVDTDGRAIRIDPRVADAETLLEAIERECVRPVRRAAFEAFEDGEVLTFGRVALDATGLTLDELELPWSDVERVHVGATRIAFHLRGRIRERSVPMDQIPYPYVLVALLQKAGANVELDRLLIPA